MCIHLQWTETFPEAEEEEVVWEMVDEEEKENTMSLFVGWQRGKQDKETNPIWAGSLWPASPTL